jgi:cytochrome P450
MSSLRESHLDSLPFLNITEPTFSYDSPEVAEAREQSWCAQTPLGVLVLRYADVQELLRDRRLIQSGDQHLGRYGITEGPIYDWFVPMLLHLNGEHHTRLRGLVQKAFTPRVINNIRPFIRSTAVELADRIALAEHCEFVDMFADPLPLAVMCHLLGVPEEDYDTFRAWSTDIGLVFALAYGDEVLPRVEAAVTGLYGYVDSLISSRQADPTNGDVISSLIRAQQDGERVSMDELRNLAVTLVFAAHDTTRHQLGQAMVTLCEHPDQWQLLGERPELAAQAVEEIGRWSPSVPVVFRFAAESFDYRGVHIPAGTFVMLCTVSAHRDPRVFANGDNFDISVTREAPQLTFGAGPHYCLGAATARAELAEALPVLTSRFGPPSLAGDVVWRSPIGIYGPASLPLRFASR